MSDVVFGIICFILECIVFVFVVVSTPIDILRVKKGVSETTLNLVPDKRTCFSVWGRKPCGAHKIPSNQMHKGFITDDVYKIVKAAAAFDIISIFCTLVCVALIGLMMCKCLGAIAPLIMATVCSITIIIAIGCMLGAYYHKLPPGLGKVKDHTNLYAGVALIVAGWCLQVTTLILLMIAACCCSSSTTEEDGDCEGEDSKHESNKSDKNEPEERATDHSEM